MDTYTKTSVRIDFFTRIRPYFVNLPQGGVVVFINRRSIIRGADD